MRTEIVIPFAFDTAPLEARLRDHGEEEVTRILHDMVRDNLVACIPKQGDYYGRETGNPDWSRLMRNYFREWLDEHVEEITDEAALILAQRGSSKRKWRDVLEEVKEDRNGRD